MTPCRGDDRFTSDDPGEREAAAEVCRSRCLIRESCLAGARSRGEQWHVWGGVDLGVVELAEPVAWVRPQVFAPQHGSRSSYVGGCHCPECSAANTKYIHDWREEHRFAAVVEHAPMPEQLDLFAQVGAVTTSERV